MTTKVCNTCLAEKPLSEYGLSGGWTRNRCRPCDSIRKAKWNAANREHKLAQQKRYRQVIAARGKSPLPLTYRRGERCWCCRREAVTAMLCKRCAGKA